MYLVLSLQYNVFTLKQVRSFKKSSEFLLDRKGYWNNIIFRIKHVEFRFRRIRVIYVWLQSGGLTNVDLVRVDVFQFTNQLQSA